MDTIPNELLPAFCANPLAARRFSAVGSRFRPLSAVFAAKIEGDYYVVWSDWYSARIKLPLSDWATETTWKEWYDQLPPAPIGTTYGGVIYCGYVYCSPSYANIYRPKYIFTRLVDPGDSIYCDSPPEWLCVPVEQYGLFYKSGDTPGRGATSRKELETAENTSDIFKGYRDTLAIIPGTCYYLYISSVDLILDLANTVKNPSLLYTRV